MYNVVNIIGDYMAKKVNYLNNKDILKQIHISKLTFCYVKDDQYGQHDIILEDVKKINRNSLKQARENRASKMQSEAYQAAMAVHDTKDYKNKPKQKEFAVEPKSIAKEDIVFRVMTMEHIPDEPGRKRNPKNEAETKAKVNFPSFKHYAYINDEITEVTRSHWKGSIGNGHFCVDHGQISNELGTMYLKLVERYSHRANWRGYTYVDEMRGQALVQLSQIGLQFNEAKSDNTFGFLLAVSNVPTVIAIAASNRT